jgi:hypothetical protein
VVSGFEWFLTLLLFLYSSFDSGCRIVKPNHLNIGVVCDCSLLSSYYSHLTDLGGNKIYFLTTGIRAFGSSGSDGRRRRKSKKNMYNSNWALLDRKVLAVIRLSLSRSVIHNVVKEKTTAGLIAALSSIYEKPLANNKMHLMKKLFDLKMAEGASVANHLNEFNTIINQLSLVNIDFDDEIRALIVLALLPNCWEAVHMAVSNSAGKSKLGYKDIRDLILSEKI